MIGILLLVLAGVAGAEVVASLPGGTVFPMPPAGYWGPGPYVFDGITWTSTNSDNYGGSIFGSIWGYGFGPNGIWDGGLGPMAGLNSAFGVVARVDAMTFEFATPVTGVGGFMNYSPLFGNPEISVYDSSHSLIESYTLNFNFNDSKVINQGYFYAFLESSPIIKYFTLSNSFVGVTNLTAIIAASTPAPTYSCLGFENPMADSYVNPVKVNGQRVIPLKAQLVDEYGSLIIDSDIDSPPLLQVMATDPDSDVTDGASFAGQGTAEKQFVFTYDGKWQFNLKTKNFTKPGTYEISLITGDGSEYKIQSPACRGKFVIE